MYARRGGGRGGRFHHGGRGRGGRFHHGRGRGRGNRGRGGRGRHNHRGNRGNNNRGPMHYNPSAFDPIEEIDDVSVSSSASHPPVRIAVEGCCHGELDVIYQRLQDHETATGKRIDLLLCCGDFQSHRNAADFHSSSIPPKYRNLGTFPSYYKGEKVAPILTVFIGGNHEASQPLRELYYGGWVAPNIYYLGAAGVVRFAGLRIGGLSGIYKSHDYSMGHFEAVPYDRSSLRSVYHVRNVDVLRMKCLSVGKKYNSDRKRIEKESEEEKGSTANDFDRPIDILLSHDWPLGIEQHGNTNDLLRRKPYFRQEVADNSLGSPPNREVLDTVRPKHWFSAHLHVKFKATVRFPVNDANTAETAPSSSDDFMALIPSQVTDRKPKDGGDQEAKDSSNETEATKIDQGETSTTEFHGLESSNAKCTAADGSTVEDLTEQMTRFLALDKCLPRRQFLSVLNVTPPLPVPTATENSDAPSEDEKQTTRPSRYRLEYDPEWLAIVRKTHHLTSTQRQRVNVPDDPTDVISPEELATETEWVVSRLEEAHTKQSSSGDTTDDSSWLAIPKDFAPTVPFYSDPTFQGRGMPPPLPAMGNPITDNLLEILELDHILTRPYDPTLTPERISSMLRGVGQAPSAFDSNEIDLEIDDEEEENEEQGPPAAVEDSNEIDIDDEEDENPVPDDNVPSHQLLSSARKGKLYK